MGRNPFESGRGAGQDDEDDDDADINLTENSARGSDRNPNT